MDNIIIIVIVAVIVTLAGMYIYKEKKKGKKCIGCPYASTCSSGKSSSGCLCGCDGASAD